MAITFQCPSCGKQLSAKENSVGKVSKCGACGGQIRIPAPASRDLPDADLMVESSTADSAKSSDWLDELRSAERAAVTKGEVRLLTTEKVAWPGFRVQQTLQMITTRRVVGVAIGRDIAMAFRDFFGGRSETAERALREMETEALAELKTKAHELGAHAVVGVRLQFGEISGNTAGQMFYLVAQGTPVVLEPAAS